MEGVKAEIKKFEGDVAKREEKIFTTITDELSTYNYEVFGVKRGFRAKVAKALRSIVPAPQRFQGRSFAAKVLLLLFFFGTLGSAGFVMARTANQPFTRKAEE